MHMKLATIVVTTVAATTTNLTLSMESTVAPIATWATTLPMMIANAAGLSEFGISSHLAFGHDNERSLGAHLRAA